MDLVAGACAVVFGFDGGDAIAVHFRQPVLLRGCCESIEPSGACLKLMGIRSYPLEAFSVCVFAFVFWPAQQNLWGDSGSGSRPKL